MCTSAAYVSRGAKFSYFLFEKERERDATNSVIQSLLVALIFQSQI